MIGADREIEPRALGADGVVHELPRWALLPHQGVPDLCHEKTITRAVIN
jgi:hypothetical protein